MTIAPKPSGWSDHYHLIYDAWNRLVTVYDADELKLVAGYDYDGLNRRIVKETYVGGSLTEIRHFYYSAQWQVLEERVQGNYYSGSGSYSGSYSGSSSSSLQSTASSLQYVWGLRYVDDLVLRDDDTDCDGILDRRFYALQDPNWNVIAIANTSGATQERYRYDAFGAPTVFTPIFGDRSSTEYDWTVLYTGRMYDSETGLYDYRNRIYHAPLGRFITRDPIGFQAGDANLYRYVGNSPVVFVDPTGEDFIAIADRPVSGTFGAGYHYSVEYWECCKEFKPLNHTKGFTPEEIVKKCPGAKEYTAAVELLADTGWQVWGVFEGITAFNQIFNPNNTVRRWKKAFEWISVVHYTDSATKIMPIFDDTPEMVKQRWNMIISAAKSYRWAEQNGFGGKFVNWPRSLYKTFQTNSNTFARYVVNQASLIFVEMDGDHPGNVTPSQNTGSLDYFPEHTPWKYEEGKPGKPKPTSSP